MDGDRIDLSAIDAIAGGNDDPFQFIGTGAFGGAGRLRYAITGTLTTVEADLDGNRIADLRITLNGAITLVAGDFIL